MPVADFLLMSNPKWTIYLQDHRGTGKSSPLNCKDGNPPSFAPYNDTVKNMYTACSSYLSESFKKNQTFFTARNAAKDLRTSIDLMGLIKVGVYAWSYGTYMTNILMQLPGKIDLVVLDGPWDPQKLYMANSNLAGLVANQLLHLCVTNSSVCSGLLGVQAQVPSFVIHGIADGSLPCLQKLPWLNNKQGAYYFSAWTYGMVATKANHPLLGPLLYRLYRCSPSDVEQLNVFYSWNQPGTLYRTSTSRFSLGLGVNVAASELYSPNKSTEPDYDDQLLFYRKELINGDGQIIMAHARYETSQQLYTYIPENKNYATPKFPVFILVGTLDPQTVSGYGLTVKNGLGTSTSQLPSSFLLFLELDARVKTNTSLYSFQHSTHIYSITIYSINILTTNIYGYY